LENALGERFYQRAGVAAVFLVATLASAATARTIYECSIEERGTNHGWLPTIVVVALDPGKDTVLVSDPMIEYATGGPIEVTPKANTDARLSLKWKLTLPATDKDELQLTFDFTILKAENRAKITAMAHGYDNNFYSQGTCKLKKG
jgi:hypothetical protein